MKNIIQYTGYFAMLLFIGACSKDFLEIAPQDRITADNFYKSESDVRANTASMYGMPWFDFNDKFFWCAGDLMSGDVYHSWDQEGQFFFGTVQDGNSVLGQGWNGLFRVISYANSVINDLPSAASGKVSQEAINRALGEAHFFRGAAYYMLGEFWEEVPLIENSTALVTSNNMIIPKNTQANVYEFVKRDLEFAEANLPATDVPGRVTKWSAKGMLAKLYVTMAQHLQDANSATNFDKAKQYAGDVITNSGLTLVANYEDLFTIAGNNNPESLFAIQWIANGWSFGNSRQAVFARSSEVTGNTQAWGGGKSVTKSFMNDVEPTDIRRKSIYMILGDHYPDINKAKGGYTYNIVSLDNKGQVLEGAAPLLNNLKKYIVGSAADFAGVGNNQDVAINQYILRLADVYLTYVEAVIGAGTSTNDATAVEYYNLIRRRAKVPEKTSVTFDDLFKERRVEFGVESIRWFDIKRMYYRDPQACLNFINAQNRADRYQRKTGDNVPDQNTMEGYELVPPDSPVVFTAEDMVLPIPVGEVGENPLLGPDVAAEEYVFK